jgi:predicted CXXCH cytochrome family protein
MKKTLVALALAAFATTASATIAGGSHDMTTFGGGLSACQYCHAPHLFALPNVTGGPLWNRNVPVAGITPYTSTTLADATVTPGVNTQTCLSCHNGTTTMSAVVNGVDPTAVGAMSGLNAGRFVTGLDLTNDHPVGVNYPATAEYVGAPGLPLYATQVECGSCHDPHGASDQAVGGAAFLRTGTVSATDLCANCHIK